MTRTRTFWINFTDCAWEICKVPMEVHFWFWKTLGSTITCTDTGVVQGGGDTEIPGVRLLIENAVAPPPGFTMLSSCDALLRLQELPRKITSCCAEATRGMREREPTGIARTPLSETASNGFPSLERTLFPPR